MRFDDRIRFGAAEARYESSELGGSMPLPKPEEIKARVAEAGTELSHLTGAFPFGAINSKTIHCAPAFSSCWELCCWSLLASIVAVLMMHAPAL